MTGLPKISDTLQKTGRTLVERGVDEHSFFTLTFADGSRVTEEEVSWSDIANPKKIVGYFGNKKSVTTCKFPVKHIKVEHDGVVAELDVPEDCEVFQAIRAETLIFSDQQRYRTIGRIFGIIKEGEVVQEMYIDALQRKVFGLKK